MRDRTVSLARIPLARQPLRLLIAPAVLLVAGVAGVVGGVLIGGMGGVGLVAGGIVVAVLAAYLALMPFTVALDVEVASLRLHWLGGERRYVLARGAVTRVPLAGEGAARLRARFGTFGWTVGPARLRGEERIDLVRLARTPSMILVPTDRGRLGIAPRSEAQLIEALTAAARVQQRLDETRARIPLPQRLPLPTAPVAPAPPDREEEEQPTERILTGIERAMLEERLAAERAAAIVAAEAERLAAATAAREAAAQTVEAAVAEAPTARRARRPRRATTESRPVRSWAPLTGLAARYAVAALPVLAAAALWLAALAAGRLQLPDIQMRALALAVVLAGPGGALAAAGARAWFPRLAWLVTLTALLALTLIGTALLG